MPRFGTLLSQAPLIPTFPSSSTVKLASRWAAPLAEPLCHETRLRSSNWEITEIGRRDRNSKGLQIFEGAMKQRVTWGPWIRTPQRFRDASDGLRG